MMKTKFLVYLWVPVIVLATLSGCGSQNTQEDDSEVITVVSKTDILYVAGHILTIDDLVDDADLIVTGTVNRTVEVVPHEKLADVWKTKSAIHVEKTFKGDSNDEIIVIQTGAVGKGENPGNPVFEVGERCFLFLTEGADGLYRLVDLQGRLRIENGRISSMNYLYPVEKDGPPDVLIYRKADLGLFEAQVMAALE